MGKSIKKVDTVIFDLDDTLYPELDFVKSGFSCVAEFLSRRFRVGKNRARRRMSDILKKQGRGKIFDALLKEFGLYSRELVKVLLFLYRSHVPSLRLDEDVVSTLVMLKNKNKRLAIITDGLCSVQRNKVKSLGLEKYFDEIIYTDELGKRYRKPSAVPFKVALNLLCTRPDAAVYVGDNPQKDIAGANRVGITTILVNKYSKKTPASSLGPDASADFSVRRIRQILPVVLS